MLRKALFAVTMLPFLATGVVQAAERTVTLAVKNMFCAACPHIVKRTLAGVSGVNKVEVSYWAKTATVTFDDSKTTVPALTSATTKAGYPSAPRS